MSIFYNKFFVLKSEQLALLFTLFALFDLLMPISQAKASTKITQTASSITVPQNFIEDQLTRFKGRFVCAIAGAVSKSFSEQQIRVEAIRKAKELRSCIKKFGVKDANPDSLLGIIFTTVDAGDFSVLVVGAGLRRAEPIQTNDRDGDGLSDEAEIRLGTNADNPDTDGGGLSDGREVSSNKNPRDPNDDRIVVDPVVPGKPRPTWLPKPSLEVDGVFQVLGSSLSGCKPGNYRVRGTFNSTFTFFTLKEAKGAEGCFKSLPTEVFNVPGLADGGRSIDFESRIGPGESRVIGSVSRVYGSFLIPIAYPELTETFGLLALNANNTQVIDPSSKPQITDQTKVISELPAPDNLPISEVLPDLLPDEANNSEIIRDKQPNSETNGLLVVRNQLRVVFAENTTVSEINAALKVIGGGIISSFEGGTIVTLKIPDTGDSDGIKNAQRILSTQPKVITTIPVIIEEAPSPIDSLDGQQFELQSSPTRNQEFIPLPLQLVKAVDKNGVRPAPIGNGQVNLFIVDWFSDPIHSDVNLVNPFYQKTIGEKPFKPYLGFKYTQPKIYLANNWFCEKTGVFCPQRIRSGTNSIDLTPLDSNNHKNIALFSNKNSDQLKEDRQKNNHGFLVSGLMAARNLNNQGVMGMYPDQNSRIFAFNAVASNLNEKILYALQNIGGSQIVNFSVQIPPDEYRSRSEGIYWIEQIRQRKLEDRVVLVQAAGNKSNRNNSKITKAEDNGTWTSAGLRDDLSTVVEKNRRECGNVGSRIWGVVTKGDPCRTVIDQKTTRFSRLKNVLVVEALDAIGSYADYSNEVANKPLGVRAIGHHSVVDPAVYGSAICKAPSPPSDPKGDYRSRGFPALTRDNEMECMVEGGTSSAAPQVAGLAAWLWSREPNLKAPDIVKRIIESQTTFQVLDQNGKLSNSGNGPVMSTLTAINVPKTLGLQGFNLTDNPPQQTNRPPIASNDQSTTSNTTKINVLANDKDPDGDQIKIISVTQGQYGKVTINSDQTLTYQWYSRRKTGDQFTYTISDNKGSKDRATVSIKLLEIASDDAKPPVEPVDTAYSPPDINLEVNAKHQNSCTPDCSVRVIESGENLIDISYDSLRKSLKLPEGYKVSFTSWRGVVGLMGQDGVILRCPQTSGKTAVARFKVLIQPPGKPSYEAERTVFVTVVN